MVKIKYILFSVILLSTGAMAEENNKSEEKSPVNELQDKKTSDVEQEDMATKPVPTVSQELVDEASQLVDKVKKRAIEQAEASQKEIVDGPNTIHVNHVPETIKAEIRQQIKAELRESVVTDVLSVAKTERWGVPGVLPDWTYRIKFKGDLRMRAQLDQFGSVNKLVYRNFLAINEAGGVSAAGDDLYLNTIKDRQRVRLRARLGVDAKIDNAVKVSFRLSTGSRNDPVSTNNTLGNSAKRSEVLWDQAYLRYHGPLDSDYPWVTFWAGRMPNPYLSTDLVWDSDLAFDGLAAKFHYNLRGSDSLFDISELDRMLYFTLGAFPLQEVELSADDKWLYGAQIGTEWVLENQSTIRFGVAYYDYRNTVGIFNPVRDGNDFDYTAPQYLQRGNTLFDIRHDSDPDKNRFNLFALAAEFEEINVTFSYDMVRFAPVHVVVVADYVKNIGFDGKEIETRTQGTKVEEKTEGYQIKVVVGWPKLRIARDWQLSLAYKYLERDAVIDAFTDSDFHLGGTDAKGYILGGSYGLADNTWVSLRLLSSDEIDGAPLGIDTWQLDLNARF